MMDLNRRHFIAGAIMGMTMLTAGVAIAAGPMTIYKDPQCGCCEQWAEAMEAAGFKVDIRDEADMTPIKTRFGVPADLEGAIPPSSTVMSSRGMCRLRPCRSW